MPTTLVRKSVLRRHGTEVIEGAISLIKFINLKLTV